MSNNAQENKLRARRKQLEDAQVKLGRDPRVFDIKEEIGNIDTRLAQISQSNVAENDLGEDISQEIETQEPFGKDLNEFERQKEEDDRKREIARKVLRNEPQKPEVPETGPRAKASAKPAEDTSMESLKSPRQTLLDRAKNSINRVRNGGKPNLPGGGAGAAAKGEEAASAAGKGAAQAGKLTAQAGKAVVSGLIRAGAAIIAWGWPAWVAIILVVIAFVIGLSYMGTISATKPSTSGGTRLIAVNSKTDSGVLQNFLKLTGDKTVSDAAITEATSKMKKDLLDTKEDAKVKSNPALLRQIDIAITALGILEGTKTLESSQNFLTQLSGVYNLMEGNIPTWPTVTPSSATSSPVSNPPTRLPSSKIPTAFNTDRHGNSFLINDPVDGDNVYTKGGSGKCDAVDIGVTTGEAIYPIFAGEIVKVSPDGEGSDASYVVVKSDDGKYNVLFAHLLTSSLTKKKGDKITLLEPLGAAKANSIQLEVYYTDTGAKTSTCLVINHADMIDHSQKNPKHKEWGGYLWDRIVKTFNLK